MAEGLRILQVAPWSVHGDGTGGMAAVVRDLSAALRDAGHHVEILTGAWNAPNPIREGEELRLRLPGPPSHRTPFQRLKGLVRHERAARALLTLCRRNAIDVIHAHYAAPYLATLARARALGGPPYLVTCHRGDILGAAHLTDHQRWAVTSALRSASARVAVSGWLAEEAKTAFALDRIETVPNGVNIPWSRAPERKSVECALERPLPPKYAVMVANMRPYKGHDIALSAWRLLRGRSDLTLVLVGGGPDFEGVQAMARCQGVWDRIVFCGYQSRETVLGIVAHATMVVAPSRSEGHPLFALEAGALGRPLVCTNIPVLMEIVDDGVSGLTVQPDDPQALADAVLRLEADAQLRNRLGTALKERIHHDFSLERMADRYVELYDSLRSAR